MSQRYLTPRGAWNCRGPATGLAPQRGQATVELAVAFSVFVIVLVGLVQIALFVHARQVVYGAAQDGARVAAADGGSLERGVEHTRDLLRVGLGQHAASVTASGRADGETVVIEVTGSLRMIIPWVTDTELPLRARVITQKEGFRVDN